MAAKKKGKSAKRAAEDTGPAAAPIIVVPPGGQLDVVVDVGPMVFPYTVAYAGHTVIKSLVDRQEQVTPQPGDFVLAWSFAHGAKGWSHQISYILDGAEPVVLEEASEKKKNRDTSIGFAVVRA